MTNLINSKYRTTKNCDRVTNRNRVTNQNQVTNENQVTNITSQINDDMLWLLLTNF